MTLNNFGATYEIILTSFTVNSGGVVLVPVYPNYTGQIIFPAINFTGSKWHRHIQIIICM